MSHEPQAGTTATEDGVPIDAALRAIWRERLLRELGNVATHSRARVAEDRIEPPAKVDVSDQHALDLERDLELILDDESGAAADAIRSALQRLDEGSFGWCVDCGQTIAIARLMALPSAARCRDCQAAAERRR
jgi:DnaK suppressor protein